MQAKYKRSQGISKNSRWLVTYAAFMTLLVVFFIVFYVISTFDDKKYKHLSEAMRFSFEVKENKDINRTRAKQNVNTHVKDLKEVPEKDGFISLNDSLPKLDGGFYKVKRYKGWYEIEMKSQMLFESGMAELAPEATWQLQILAQALRGSTSPIIIEGHTDNVPIHSLIFPSNWELSAARAAAVARVLDTSGVKPSRLLTIGFASQYPLVSNSTDKGKERNRRVVIIIAKDYNVVARLLQPRNKLKAYKDSQLASPLKSSQPVKDEVAKQEEQ